MFTKRCSREMILKEVHHEKSDYQVHPFGGNSKSLADLNKNRAGRAHKKRKNKQGKEIRDFQYIGKKELFFHIKKSVLAILLSLQ